jgi:CubicO group peptidase (beta-lactamase class C family)
MTGANSTDLFAQLDAKIEAGLKRYGIPGAAVGVWHRGREYLKGYGVTNVGHPRPVDGKTLFRIGSSSKTLCGTTAMVLVDRGQLDLDAKVRNLVPGFEAPRGAGDVTVRQCLNHSAGWLGYDYHDTGRGSDALARYAADIRRLPQLTRPGTVFAYNNAAISLAGRVVERIARMPYEDAVRQLVLDPVGMADTYFFSDEIIGYDIAACHDVDDHGSPVVLPSLWHLPRGINPFGGAISNAADQLAYARFHLGDGSGAGGKRVLSEAALKAMHANPGPGGTLLVELDGMGVAWMIRPTAEGPKVIQHGGDVPGQHSGLMLVPECDFAIILLTNSEQGRKLVAELFVDDWGLARFAGLHNLPAVRRKLDSAALAAYEGRYTAEQIDTSGKTLDLGIELKARDGGLEMTLAAAGGREQRFLAFYKEDYVLVDDADAQPAYLRANFIRDSRGQVRWLRLGGRLARHVA